MGRDGCGPNVWSEEAWECEIVLIGAGNVRVDVGQGAAQWGVQHVGSKILLPIDWQAPVA